MAQVLETWWNIVIHPVNKGWFYASKFKSKPNDYPTRIGTVLIEKWLYDFIMADPEKMNYRCNKIFGERVEKELPKSIDEIKYLL